MCLSFLKELQASVTLDTTDSSNATDVYIASGVDQIENEQFLNFVVDAIEFGSTFSSQECVDAFLPFMCQYLFPLCNTSGDLLLPSQEECLAISTGVCQAEWDLLSRVAADYIPHCADLPRATDDAITGNFVFFIRGSSLLCMSALIGIYFPFQLTTPQATQPR